jgi:ABC-type glycerol-3-phosphate transport system permease component
MKAGRGLFLLVLILGAAGPLYLLLKVSVSPPGEVMTPQPLLLPHAVTWRFWHRVLESGQITAPLWKSLGAASGVALLALTLAGPAAYSLAQLPVRWRPISPWEPRPCRCKSTTISIRGTGLIRL